MEENNDWGRSVAAVVVRKGKVLLARHTYGGGKGKLIIPGGYLRHGEGPEEALRRELAEETGITAEPLGLLAIRFNQKDWYAVFLAAYTGGEARSDRDENSEVLWMDPEEVSLRDDVPDLTKKLVAQAFSGRTFFTSIPYEGNMRNGPYVLLGDAGV